jgi:hypothetical protein
MTGRHLVVAALLGALLLAACTSPEATRLRAGGPGADVGNRKPPVMMHDGADPFWSTRRVDGISGPPLEPSRQASGLSQR